MGAQKSSIQVLTGAGLPGLELRTGVAVSDPVPTHWHDEYQFCLITGGAGTLTYKGTVHRTPTATLFMMPPGEIHSNECTDPNGCSYRSMFVQPSLMQKAAETVRLPETLPDPVTEDTRIVDAFQRLHDRFLRGEGNLCAQEQLIDFLLLALRSPEPAGSKNGEHDDDPRLRRAFEYLCDHFAEDVTLDALANEAGLSIYHFSRRFACRFGVPPHHYQTQLRIVKAKSMLLRGLSIGEVAIEVGFSDQSHLNRHFKRLTAVTPGRYGKRSKNVQD